MANQLDKCTSKNYTKGYANMTLTYIMITLFIFFIFCASTVSGIILFFSK